MSFPQFFRAIFANKNHTLPADFPCEDRKPQQYIESDSVTCSFRNLKNAGRTSGHPCFHGSLTVEASLVMPLFIFAVYLIWCFFGILTLHVHIQQAADQVAGSLAEQSYLAAAWEHGTSDTETKSRLAGISKGISVESVLTDAVWKSYAESEVRNLVGEEFLEDAWVVSGADGLSLWQSSWDQNGDLDLQVDYTVELPALLGFRWQIDLTQHSLRRSWTGSQSGASGSTEGDGEADVLVYVTETGRVYHRDISCYHLNLTIREVSFGSVGSERNQNGAKYYPCEKCAVGVEIGSYVFIAKEGNRYHTTRDCSGLKRTVNTVPLSQVGGKRACSNCGGE